MNTSMAIEPVMREKAAVAAGDATEYLAALADDAVFLPPNSAPKTGADLRAWLAAFVRDVRVEWLTFDSIELDVAEDLAYHVFSYTWRVTPRAGGDPTTSGGKGLHILRRQSDGRWKIAREIWNSTPRQ